MESILYDKPAEDNIQADKFSEEADDADDDDWSYNDSSNKSKHDLPNFL